MFIDHRPTLKLILRGLEENLTYLRSLPAVPIFSCNQTIKEIKRIKELLETMDQEWLDRLDKKDKKDV